MSAGAGTGSWEVAVVVVVVDGSEADSMPREPNKFAGSHAAAACMAKWRRGAIVRRENAAWHDAGRSNTNRAKRAIVVGLWLDVLSSA